MFILEKNVLTSQNVRNEEVGPEDFFEEKYINHLISGSKETGVTLFNPAVLSDSFVSLELETDRKYERPRGFAPGPSGFGLE
jgi:hypothetical protein